ncbi:hypothetical protein [Thiomonas sp.]
MTSLVLTIMSIALLAAMALATVSYLPADTDSISTAQSQVSAGFISLQNGYNAYVAATGSVPTTANWSSVLTPQYVFLPAAPLNTSWAYTAGAPYSGSATGNYFCLSGTMNQAQYTGMINAARQFSPQAFFYGSACGATSDAATPTTWPATVAVTFWVYAN